MGGRPWSPAEEAVLRRHYADEGAGVARRLPGRTQGACYTCACRLGLGSGKRRRWTPEEEALLCAHYPFMGGPALARSGMLPGRNASMIAAHANGALGLRRRRCRAWTRWEDRAVVKCIPRLERRPDARALERLAGALGRDVADVAARMIALKEAA